VGNYPDISVVIPLYNEEESLHELCSWIEKVMVENDYQYEVLLIDDGSTDNSWNVITELSEQFASVKGIKFNRNYGKSAALNTGFKHTTGEVVITMDADLQDSPDEIPALVKMITNNGLDLVSGWKKKRHDPISKTIPSKFFNFVTRLFSGIKLHDFNCGLKAYKNKVVKSIDVYGEMHRYIPFIAKWHGFDKIGELVVEHRARKYGTTKFGLERFVFGFLDLISITFVSKFKKRPMHFFGTFGTLSMLVGIFITIWVIGSKVYNIYNHLPVRDVVDQPIFFLALVAIIIGVQLFLAGFLAEMMIQTGAKKEDYIVSEKLGLD
jgi:glycosyltransferase involved in cell wall biosynthesis